MKLLVTGGSGFIGSTVVRQLLSDAVYRVVNVDKLTYAANPLSLKDISDHPRYLFEHADICDQNGMARIFATHRPDGVINLAAESHVDRSIDGPDAFLRTNVHGTFVMLEEARRYWRSLDGAARDRFRFLHVSTDEVYGDLENGQPVQEDAPFAPGSPYAASKAAADHLAFAWRRTYDLPILISNCTNNFGPYQFPEKLIPLTILNALDGRSLPVYGDGTQVRDWLFVEDHARALVMIILNGVPGRKYNVSASCERKNIDLVRSICRIVDRAAPDSAPKNHEDLIELVADRPGHDRRYALDAGRIKSELNWSPQESFESGLEKTVQWYIDNPEWWQPLRENIYQGERLGLETVEGARS